MEYRHNWYTWGLKQIKTVQQSLCNRILQRVQHQNFPRREKRAYLFLERNQKTTKPSHHLWSWCQQLTYWESRRKQAKQSLRSNTSRKTLIIKKAENYQALSMVQEMLANKGFLRPKTISAGSALLSPSVRSLQQLTLANWPKIRKKDNSNNRKCKITKLRRIQQDQGMKVVLMLRRWSASWTLLSKVLKKISVFPKQPRREKCWKTDIYPNRIIQHNVSTRQWSNHASLCFKIRANSQGRRDRPL